MSDVNQTPVGEELSPVMLNLWEQSTREDRNLGFTLGFALFAAGIYWAFRIVADLLVGIGDQQGWWLLLAIIMAFLGLFIIRRVGKPRILNTARLNLARPGVIRGWGRGVSVVAGITLINVLRDPGGIGGAVFQFVFVLFFLVSAYYCYHKADVVETLQNALHTARSNGKTVTTQAAE